MNDPLTAYRSGSSEPWTVEALCAIAKALRPALILETGTYEALTTRKLFEAMSTLDRASRIITVEMDEQRFAAADTWIQTWDEHVHVAVELWQTDALTALRGIQANAVDFVFLDDDHTPMHVAEEIREVQRILRPGGVCCVHDVVGPFGLDAVVRMAGGICLPFERLHAAGGLGIMVK